MNRLKIVFIGAFLFLLAMPKMQAQNERIQLSGWINAQYYANFTDGESADNTFRMRRARVALSGKLTDRFSYKLQGDFCNSSPLVDAYINFKVNKYISLQLGQYKLPFSLESPISPMNIESIEYGHAISKLVGYKDVSGVGKLGRDIGLSVIGGFVELESRSGKKFNLISYNVGVFNGNGINGLDNNTQKDVVGRIEIRPIAKLVLAGSFYTGRSTTEKYTNGIRNRQGVGAQFSDSKWMIRGEYLWGQTGLKDDPTKSAGAYMQLGRWFDITCKGEKAVEQKIMPLLRYDYFAEDVNNDNSPTSYYTLGFSYWCTKYVSFKANYSLTRPKSETKADGSQLIFQLSVKF